jgi:hypothetical protein
VVVSRVAGVPRVLSVTPLQCEARKGRNPVSASRIKCSSLLNQRTNQPTKELTKGGDLREAQVDVPLSG